MPIINSVIKGGAAPVIDTLNVTPTTSAQQITAPQGMDGYSPVNVSAVTSSIDANIIAGNIKDGVTILGVTGDYTGTTPTGTKNITANGIHDVSGYASADVQVPTTAPDYYVEFPVDNNHKLSRPTSFIDLTGVKDLGAHALTYLYYSSNITSADFKDVEVISGSYACAQLFAICSSLVSFSAPKLKNISGASACQNIFSQCNNIEDVEFPVLETISGNYALNGAFMQANRLKTVRFPKLETISGNSIFGLYTGCITASNVNIYFNGLKTTSVVSLTALDKLFSSSGCTIHFPSNLDPQTGSTLISSLTGYPNFGGTNTVLAFDLPATE